jgi:OOP family OmpA-OmpF porin
LIDRIRATSVTFLGLGYELHMEVSGRNGDASRPDIEAVTTIPEEADTSISETVSIDQCREQLEGSLAEGGIQFRNGSTALRRDSRNLLKKMAGVLKGCPDNSVMITGHTDSRGGTAANQKLSEARARVVGSF